MMVIFSAIFFLLSGARSLSPCRVAEVENRKKNQDCIFGADYEKENSGKKSHHRGTGKR